MSPQPLYQHFDFTDRHVYRTDNPRHARIAELIMRYYANKPISLLDLAQKIADAIQVADEMTHKS